MLGIFELLKSSERFQMAAYEDWIPLDNDIFNRLDNCDPSFCWELMKNDVIKVWFSFSDFANLLKGATKYPYMFRILGDTASHDRDN